MNHKFFSGLPVGKELFLSQLKTQATNMYNEVSRNGNRKINYASHRIVETALIESDEGARLNPIETMVYTAASCTSHGVL